MEQIDNKDSKIHSNTFGNVNQRYLLCLGYIRRFLTEIHIDDIAKVVLMYAEPREWIFDYFYDFENHGSTFHGIENNGKTLKCNCSGSYGQYSRCYCFFCSYSFGMKPNSGKYQIKIQINRIDNDRSGLNIIGIISQNYKNNEKISEKLNKENTNVYWQNEFYDYIGWSSRNKHTEDHGYLPNGLLCGWHDNSLRNNIFRSKKFIYKSNNEYNKHKLDTIRNGDIIILSYDSDEGVLSFGKENDNGQQDSQISNLPKTNTFYWFVGHSSGKLSLTVL